jgi:hypothetical protein
VTRDPLIGATVEQLDGQWAVKGSDGLWLAGPFGTNAKAWAWLERRCAPAPCDEQHAYYSKRYLAGDD